MTNVKMFMFARWVSTCYADDHIDEKKILVTPDHPEAMSVLNREDGEWWKK